MKRPGHPAARDSPPRLPRRAPLLPAALVAFATAIVLALALARAIYPYDLGHFEAATWAPAQLVAEGRNPYGTRLVFEPPFVGAPYGPVFYAVLGLGFRLFGPQFWFGRALAAASMLAAGACLVVLTYRFAPERAPLTALAFLAQLPVPFWIGVHRPDAFALALSLLALASIVTEAPPRWPAVMGAALAAAAAVLTRQTSVLPVVVIVAWLVAMGRARAALGFVLLVTGALAGVTLWLEAGSERSYLWETFALQAGFGWSLSQLLLLASMLAAAPASWLVAALSLLAFRPAHVAAGTSPTGVALYETVARGYLVLAAGLAALTCARPGSNVNYWLEASAAAALVAPLAWRGRTAGRGYMAVLGALVLALAVTVAALARAERARWRARPYLDEVVAALRRAEPIDAPVLSAYPELATYAGRRCYFNDPVLYNTLAAAHAPLLPDALEARIFAAVVTPLEWAPPGYELLKLAPGTAPSPAYLAVRR